MDNAKIWVAVDTTSTRPDGTIGHYAYATSIGCSENLVSIIKALCDQGATNVIACPSKRAAESIARGWDDIYSAAGQHLCQCAQVEDDSHE